MPALGNTFKNIPLTQTPSFFIAITIPINILISEKKLKKKRTHIFIDELITLTSFNTALLSGQKLKEKSNY